jgi:hypothetical protein
MYAFVQEFLSVLCMMSRVLVKILYHHSGLFRLQDTNKRCKLLTGNAGLDTHSTGFPQWSNLPWELQRWVLASHALSLQDLAKLAPLGKVFKEVYLERCAGEEQWLEHAAVSVFGLQAVDSMVCWLLTPKEIYQPAGKNPFSQKFQLSEGEPWPDLRLVTPGHMTTVQQPARFPLRDVQDFQWHFYSTKKFRNRTILLENEVGPASCGRFFHMWFMGRQLRCSVYPQDTAHVLPCLGLVYLACKKAAESLGRWRNPAVRQGQGLGYVSVSRQGFSETEWPLIDVPGAPPDVQRAFTAISMRSWSSGRRKFGLYLSWQRWAPDQFCWLFNCGTEWLIMGCLRAQLIGPPGTQATGGLSRSCSNHVLLGKMCMPPPMCAELAC